MSLRGNIFAEAGQGGQFWSGRDKCRAATVLCSPLCSVQYFGSNCKNCIVLPKIACSSTVWGEDQVVINAFLHFDSKQICAFFAAQDSKAQQCRTVLCCKLWLSSLQIHLTLPKENMTNYFSQFLRVFSPIRSTFLRSDKDPNVHWKGIGYLGASCLWCWTI